MWQKRKRLCYTTTMNAVGNSKKTVLGRAPLRVYLLNIVTALGHTGVVVVLTLACALLLSWLTTSELVEVPTGTALAPSGGGDITVLSVVVTVIMVAVTVVVFLIFPYFVGSVVARAVRASLRYMRVASTARARFVTHQAAVVIVFSLLAVMVVGTGQAAGYPLLLLGGLVALASAALYALSWLLVAAFGRDDPRLF